MRSFIAVRLSTLAAVSLFGCHRVPELPPEPAPVTPSASAAPAPSLAKPAASARPSPSEKRKQATLEKIELKIGTGPAAKDGDRVTVAYIGRLMSAKEFGTRSKHDPFTFTIGSAKVIQGWNEGIAGMRVGGQRRLVIPANLAYGAAGKPPRIPPNAPLWYDVDLLKINGKP
jgi:FKBP-type peptidyl-prolyl cis-trans isomerase FkpA